MTSVPPSDSPVLFHVEPEPASPFDSPARDSYGPAVLPELAASLAQELADLDARDRLRGCPQLAGSTRSRATLDGQDLVNVSSNDYLGLAAHPALATAAGRAAVTAGFGAGASRLVSGDLPPHRQLELALAAYFGRPAALVFPTGYQTNLGVLTALAGPDDLIVSDAANHASIIDGCRLSRARVLIYPHRQVTAAREALRATGTFRRRFLVTESVFSMDGDVAPLADLAELTRRARAGLIVDEAHAVGALGPAGAGLCAAAGVVPDALVGTLGKAFGAAGGFAAGVPELRAYLVNRARTFLFTTALPPPVAAAAEAALQIAASPEGDTLRASLAANVAGFAAQLAGTPHAPAPASPPTAIFPIILGTDRAALDAALALRRQGFFVQAIRPPTVPEGKARLRVTLSAAHTRGEVAALADALRRLPPTPA
jgi:8-amino-7-oxononanoate synthase